MQGKLYMNIPYSEKENAKALGARWDPAVKKWYFKGDVHNYVKFAKWISQGDNQTIIAHKAIYIVEGTRCCFRCNQPTRVIGFGIGEHTSIFREDEDCYYSETILERDDYSPMFLSWAYDEREIPPAMLKYLERVYSVRSGYSNIVGDCFANHCDCCGTIQGNYYLFCEDSPLNIIEAYTEEEIRKRFSVLKIYRIHIDEDIALGWSIGYSNFDDFYLWYGSVQDIKLLPNQKDNRITYRELYEI